MLPKEGEKSSILKISYKLFAEKSNYLIEDVTPPKLLAFCSRITNKIRIRDLEAEQDYATFEGVQLSDGNIFIYNG